MTQVKAFVMLLATLVPGRAEELKPIFDGKTLAGWRQLNGTARYFVDNGELVGETSPGSANSFLCTTKDYGDFILEFEVKDDPALNSGVQIRSHTYKTRTTVLTENNGKRQRTWDPGRVYGYQIEIADEKSGASGGIFEEARRGWVNKVPNTAFRDNQWNKFRVVAMGDSIKTWTNGIAVADLVDSEEQTGFIGLQVHQFSGGRTAQVRFRNIRLQDLGRHEWRPLWDGRTMSGWTKFGGGEWLIEDGALHGVSTAASKERGFLMTDREFGDFTVRLKYKAVTGNSGFFFRMADPNASQTGAIAYEVEVDPLRDAGGLLEPRGRQWLYRPEAMKAAEYYKPNDWNDLSVSAHSGRIVVHLNGAKTAGLENDAGRAAGRLALQINPRQDIDVWFKDMEVLCATGSRSCGGIAPK